MKFYLHTTSIGRCRKPLIGRMRFEVQLVSIGIACENGTQYYAVSNEFDEGSLSSDHLNALPPSSLWHNNLFLADDVVHYLTTQAGKEPVEFLGYNSVNSFYSFATLWGGIDRMPKGLPRTIIDVAQTLIEFMEFIEPAYFLKDEDMDVQDKMLNFFDLPGCPPMNESAKALDEAIWIRDFNEFLDSRKADLILPNS